MSEKRCGSCQLVVEGSCDGAKCHSESRFVERVVAPGSAFTNSTSVPCCLYHRGKPCKLVGGEICGSAPCVVTRHA